MAKNDPIPGDDQSLFFRHIVNSSPALLHTAVKAAQGSDQPIELLVENAQFFKTYSVVYHDGEKNPHLERVPDQADILGDILKPLTQ